MDKPFRWRAEKNAWPMRERGVRFELIVEAIAAGKLLDVRENRSRAHPRQRVFIVELHGYPWVVPFEESAQAIQLKTAFPDRRLKDEFGIETHADGGGEEDLE